MMKNDEREQLMNEIQRLRQLLNTKSVLEVEANYTRRQIMKNRKYEYTKSELEAKPKLSGLIRDQTEILSRWAHQHRPPPQLTFDEYQKRAAETAMYPEDKGVEYLIMGLLGEAGELANKYKKVIRGDYKLEEIDAYMVAEAMDVLWYIAQLMTELDIHFASAAQANLDKLASRKERGVIKGSGDDR